MTPIEPNEQPNIESLREKADSNFLEVIDGLRELRKKDGRAESRGT
jgi:hypothetical protein